MLPTLSTIECMEARQSNSRLQVYFHLTVRREDDRVVETTRLSDDGVEGSGVPKAFVLGKGLRAPRGWELALYGEPLCSFAMPWTPQQGCPVCCSTVTGSIS